MTMLFGLITIAAGFIGAIFNKPLARSMMKYYPEHQRPKMLKVNRVAYVLIGCWMIVISLWVLLRPDK
jgi:uncharacterized membrane protein HdeD (DUF308 family)